MPNRIAPIPLLLAAACAGAPAPATPARPDWAQVVRDGYAVPAGTDAFAGLRLLAADFGAADPVARDDHAFGIAAQWLVRQQLLDEAQLRQLAEEWLPGLQDGLGTAGDLRVLRRSFTALALSLLAARDLRTPFLGADGVARLAAAGADYLVRERDLRDHEPALGWIHATAHAADLLKFLARNPAATAADLERIAAAVAQRLATPMPRAFAMGEDERLARTMLAVAAQAAAQPLAARWTNTLAEQVAAVRAAPFAPERLAIEQNCLHVLRAMHGLLPQAEGAPAAAWRAAVAATLARL